MSGWTCSQEGGLPVEFQEMIFERAGNRRKPPLFDPTKPWLIGNT